MLFTVAGQADIKAGIWLAEFNSCVSLVLTKWESASQNLVYTIGTSSINRFRRFQSAPILFLSTVISKVEEYWEALYGVEFLRILKSSLTPQIPGYCWESLLNYSNHISEQFDMISKYTECFTVMTQILYPHKKCIKTLYKISWNFLLTASGLNVIN